jgi:polyketide synthase PksJ
LRKNGVYLVTGGLGNIGLMFAKLLAKEAGARLILTGRSSFPAKHEWNQWLETHDAEDPISLKIKKLREIEAPGGEVLYIQADVAHHQQMQHAISQAEEAFDTINGVIHAAGIIEGESMRLLQDLSANDCLEQFQAKVYGTLILEELFKDKHLDFCWMLSSISCVLGGLGFGAYASANVFMDTLVKRHNQFNGSRWFSLNWDGMEADKSIAIFKRMLPLKKIDQLVVANGGNLHERINRWIKLETLKEKKSTSETISNLYPRPDLSTPYVAPGNTNEETIANIWQELLGYDKIGVHDDFLELGGDSLKSITLLSRIHQELNINVPLTEFFTRSTIREFAEYILAHPTNDKKSIYDPIKSVEKKEYYPASSAQGRLYVMQQTKTDDISYNMSYVEVVDDEFDENRLLESFRKLIRRHESLRTSFEIVKEKVVQRIDPGAAFDIEYFEIGTGENQDAEEKRKEIDGIITRFIRPFDLSTAPLLRIGVIKIEGENPLMIVDMHHIISDGISLHIIVKDFMMFYTGKDLPGLMFQYKDYSQWQNSKKTRLAIKRQEEYWLKEFEGEIPELLLPYDYPRPAKQSFEGDMVNFTFEENTLGRLKELAVKEDATFFMVLIAIYNIFLAKLTGQEDIVIGTGVAGRRHDELRQLIGLFVNTLALRNFPRGDKTFKAFLKEVKEKTLGAFENQDYPLEELVEKVVKNRSFSRNPLFDAVIVSQNVEVEKGSSYNWESPGLNIKPYYYANKISKFDISLLCTQIGDKLVMGVEYCTKLFKKETIDEFIGYFNEIVTHVLENKDIKLMDIAISHDILSAASVNPEMELAFLD